MADKTINASAQITSAPRTSILCDGRLLDNIIEEFGIDVVIRIKARVHEGTEAYDDGTVTTSEHRTRAFLNTYNESDEEVKEGVFEKGTIILTFGQVDKEYIKTGNEVWFDNKWFQMARIETNYVATSAYNVSVSVSRI